MNPKFNISIWEVICLLFAITICIVTIIVFSGIVPENEVFKERMMDIVEYMTVGVIGGVITSKIINPTKSKQDDGK